MSSVADLLADLRSARGAIDQSTRAMTVAQSAVEDAASTVAVLGSDADDLVSATTAMGEAAEQAEQIISRCSNAVQAVDDYVEHLCGNAAAHGDASAPADQHVITSNAGATTMSPPRGYDPSATHAGKPKAGYKSRSRTAPKTPGRKTDTEARRPIVEDSRESGRYRDLSPLAEGLADFVEKSNVLLIPGEYGALAAALFTALPLVAATVDVARSGLLQAQVVNKTNDISRRGEHGIVSSDGSERIKND